MEENLNYNRIAKLIEYLNQNFKSQPSLDQMAEIVHLSPFHFQRLFSEWAGTSPKNFINYLNINYAKKLLQVNQLSLAEATFETGLSSTSRLHDLFVKIEKMTPAEFKNGGKNLDIHYSFNQTLFGSALIASTIKGICYIAFYEDENLALNIFFNQFNQANLILKDESFHQNAIDFLNNKPTNEIKLHLKGTDFQLKVWEALLKIPEGQLSTYGQIATQIQNPSASRAVGTAIGRNPIAFIIPCHRVIQSSGTIGGYMWGPTRKAAIIGWEAAKINLELS